LPKKGIYLKWPEKKIFTFHWSTFHSFLLIILFFHIAVILLIKNSIVTIPKQKIFKLNIKLVKSVNFKKPDLKEKSNLSTIKEPNPESDKKVVKTTDKGANTNASRDLYKANSRPRKTEKEKVAEKVKISLPGTNYPQVRSIPPGKIQRIPKIGKSGENYDEYRITYTPLNEGAGGNPRGSGDGQELPVPEGGWEKPWVLWDYKFKVGRTVNHPVTIQESFGFYLEASDADPFLVGAIVPFSQEVDELGVGYVRFTATIPAIENQPGEGVHPVDIVVLEVNPRNPDVREDMERIATTCVQRSLWYPAKMGGQTVTKNVEFTLRFYGKEGKKN